MIPRLHLIVGADVLARPDFGSELSGISSSGVSVGVHLRARDLGARALLAAARRIRALPNLVLLVNDRIDVALAADALGVHLAQHSVDAATARALLGENRLIGASVHGVEEALAERAADADFLLVGSMFPTQSHPGRTPEGVKILHEIASADPRPCVAIGGISPGQVEVLCSQGAFGVAVKSGVWGGPDPVGAVREYRDALAEVDT